MLSYQHLYHAGNLADVHKHWVLAWMLTYLVRKDKPLSYLETHAGRGLYDLSADEARKTGEAEAGIARLWPHLEGSALGDVVTACRAAHGPTAYPGSPWIADSLLRPVDKLHLAELHPKEHAELKDALPSAHVVARDGFEMALSLCPPEPRRGVIHIDPSYEVKTEYEQMPKHIGKIAKAWPVGIVMLWYPVLTDGRHKLMIEDLNTRFPDALSHEVSFAPVRDGHRMIGSGVWVLNPPWGLDDAVKDISTLFEPL